MAKWKNKRLSTNVEDRRDPTVTPSARGLMDNGGWVTEVDPITAVQTSTGSAPENSINTMMRTHRKTKSF